VSAITKEDEEKADALEAFPTRNVACLEASWDASLNGSGLSNKQFPSAGSLEKFG
jgi:hypothetical protein